MITIHCGLPKTGTSSIQAGLRIARDTSRRQIWVPSERDENSEEWWIKCLTKMGRTRDGILSHEGLLFGNGGKDLISQERVELLRGCLLGSRFQIVIYLRPQIDWLASLYLHSVAGGSTEGAELFWQRMRPQELLIWSNLLTLLRTASGAENVVIRAHAHSRDVVSDFFNLCNLGSPPRVGRTMIRENISIRAVQAPIMIAINGQSDEREAVKLRQVFQQVLALDAPGGFSPFSESIQEAISSRYLEDWALVGESLRKQDAAESEVFHSELVRWSTGPIPFAGDSLSDPLIERESVRLIRLLSLKMEIGKPRRMARIRAKLRNDPMGLPSVAERAVRRRMRRRFAQDGGVDTNASN